MLLSDVWRLSVAGHWVMISDVWRRSVCLSRAAYIGPKSRTERPRKTKIGTEVAHRPLCSSPCWLVRRLQRWAWGRVVGRGKLLLRCRLLGSARWVGAHGGGEGRGIPWRPPAYSLLTTSLICCWVSEQIKTQSQPWVHANYPHPHRRQLRLSLYHGWSTIVYWWTETRLIEEQNPTNVTERQVSSLQTTMMTMMMMAASTTTNTTTAAISSSTRRRRRCANRLSRSLRSPAELCWSSPA